ERMSMLRLLSAGKSLVGLRDTGKQYQLLDSRSLPKFGKSGGKAVGGKIHRSNSKFLENSKTEKPQIPTPSIQGESAEQALKRKAEAAGMRRGVGWIGTFLTRLKPMIRPGEKNAAIPRFSAGPVQCELSLENVKVLRNDLSDTDFEVVAKPVPPAASTEPKPPPQGSREKIWNRVTTLLGAGQ